MKLVPGQIFAEKYRIVRLLGQGGMGAVYEGENTRIHRRVAIKTLHAGVAEKQDVVQRFEREAQAAGRIGSEHIVEVLDLGDTPDGSRFMVMEFLEGSTLEGRIRESGKLSPEQAAPIVMQLLEGLGAAHKASIIHRDLKPANVHIGTDRLGHDFVKILDFGVSKFSALSDEMSMTRTGAVVGTPFYMSPEQAKGAKGIDGRSDLYAVGVILYECITGQVPFHAETFNELIFKIVLEAPPPAESFVPDLDPSFAAIVRRAMGREPAERFQSADEFKAALGAWLEGDATAKAAGPSPAKTAVLNAPPKTMVMAAPAGHPAAAHRQGPHPPGSHPSGQFASGQGHAVSGTAIAAPETTAGMSGPAIGYSPPKRSAGPLIAFLVIGGIAVLGGGGYAAMHFSGDTNASSGDDAEKNADATPDDDESTDDSDDTDEDASDENAGSGDESEETADESQDDADEDAAEDAADDATEDADGDDAGAGGAGGDDADSPIAAQTPPNGTQVDNPPPGTGAQPPPPSTGSWKPPPPPPDKGGREITGEL